MPLYRKKPVTVEATQWWSNGDHPDDHADRMRPDADECEGLVVRYFRHPDVSDSARHCDLPNPGRPNCTRPMHEHGWIDTIEGGHTVCPGDWVITGVAGERYPCAPEIFAVTYEPVEASS